MSETRRTGLEQEPIPPSERGKGIGAMLGWGFIVAALVLAMAVFFWTRNHPRSDDGFVSAPVVGIAPRVSGPIVELPIEDNEFVPKGEVLFKIDEAPYRLAVEAAMADLAVVEGELANARGLVASQLLQVDAAAARLAQAEAVEAEAAETYRRLAPLEEPRFATPEEVGAARRAAEESKAGATAARAEWYAAQEAVQSLTPIEARRMAATAALGLAELALKDCTIRAPFDARVAGMELAVGAFARAGVDTFTVIDTTDWHVIVHFNESILRDLKPGQRAEVEIQTFPGQSFEGTVESIGWGVSAMPEDPFPGLPIVMKQLDWVRLAQKFPVCIRLADNVPREALRVGATASATVMLD